LAEEQEARRRQRAQNTMKRTIRQQKARGQRLRRKHARIPETELDFWDEPGSVPIARFRTMHCARQTQWRRWRHRNDPNRITTSGSLEDEPVSIDDVLSSIDFAADALQRIYNRWETWPIPDQVEQRIMEAESLRNHAHNHRNALNDPLTAAELD